MMTSLARCFRTATLAASLLAGFPAVSPARAETVPLPDGMMVELPEGWRLDAEAGSVDKNGTRRIQLVCESEHCEQRTQETCTIMLRPQEKLEGGGDAEKLRALYASPYQRYLRLRAVLRATSRDAEILKPLELTRIGEHDWWRVETDARHNFKSGLYAETVLDGHYVGMICKTCETGAAPRHQDGLKIMMSLRSDKTKAAAALSPWK